MCGSVYNAISHTPRNTNQEISIHSWKSVSKKNEMDDIKRNVIKPPDAPKEIKEYLSSMGLM
jgi:hypothetical protein